MAEYPPIGINEEELRAELNEEMKNYVKITKSSMVYGDVGDSLDQLDNGNIPASKKIEDIIGANAGELWIKKIEQGCSYAKISLLVDLCKKYFPDSEILKNEEIKSVIEEMRTHSKRTKKTLREFAFCDIHNTIEHYKKNNLNL